MIFRALSPSRTSRALAMSSAAARRRSALRRTTARAAHRRARGSFPYPQSPTSSPRSTTAASTRGHATWPTGEVFGAVSSLSSVHPTFVGAPAGKFAPEFGEAAGNRQPQRSLCRCAGAVAMCVGIGFSAVSGCVSILDQAARSIGVSASLWLSVCHPSTLRMVI